MAGTVIHEREKVVSALLGHSSIAITGEPPRHRRARNRHPGRG
jgi:hypothetical protein